MKVLAIKAFSRPQNVKKFISETRKNLHSADIKIFDYCPDDTYRVENTSDEFGSVLYEKREFTELKDHYKEYRLVSSGYDVVFVFSDDKITIDHPLNEITELFEDKRIGMVYSDFNVRVDGIKIPCLNFSAPSPLDRYPLFAFRGGILNNDVQDLPKILSQQVFSKHIPKRMITINEN